MTTILNVVRHIFRVKILIILGLYFYSVIGHKPIFLFTKCHNWYEETDECKDTNVKIALLSILCLQDVIFTYKIPLTVCSPLFYTVSFLFFLSIFSVSCNVYLDIITVSYNLFLFITSYFVYNEYETILETKNQTNQNVDDDYPNVEIRKFRKKKPLTVYYQAIDEI